MSRYEDLLVTQHSDLSKTVKFRHDIDTGDHPPIRQTPYRLPPVHIEWVKQEIQELLKAGTI